MIGLETTFGIFVVRMLPSSNFRTVPSKEWMEQKGEESDKIRTESDWWKNLLFTGELCPSVFYTVVPHHEP